jgi:hypothetical protein
MVFQGDADMVLVPGVLGEMGILPNHAPLLSTLKFGILKVRYQGKEEVFTVAGGIVEVQPDIVTVLADAAENVLEIDVQAKPLEAGRRIFGLVHLLTPTPIWPWRRYSVARTCAWKLLSAFAAASCLARLNPVEGKASNIWLSFLKSLALTLAQCIRV